MKILYLIFVFNLLLPLHREEGGQLSQQQKGYDLSKPDARLVLPPILMEVSGITWLSQDMLLAEQDEDGMIFFYDTKLNRIASQKTFGLPGDYEDIAVKGKTIFVLRSDGTIFRIEDYSQSQPKTLSFASLVPAPDNEGLCFDSKLNRLLIAPKGRINDEKSRNRRFVYSFSLVTGKPESTPAFTIELSDVRRFALGNNPELVKKNKDGKVKEPDIALEASAIAIHPITGRLYMISASDRLLFVFGSGGKTEKIYLLHPKLFPQPEGITFSPSGDMYISNEGRDGAATILKFSYK